MNLPGKMLHLHEVRNFYTTESVSPVAMLVRRSYLLRLCRFGAHRPATVSESTW